MVLDRQELVSFVRTSGKIYWGANQHFPTDLFTQRPIEIKNLGRRWTDVVLPEKYRHIGVDGKLLVDYEAAKSFKKNELQTIDWYLAAFSFLSAAHEYSWERKVGIIHSYGNKLKLPARYFEKAWVNRIFILMRELEAASTQRTAESIFGPLPQAQFYMTFDIDALDKTLQVRIKQSAFHLLQSVHLLRKFNFSAFWMIFVKALRISFTRCNYDRLWHSLEQVKQSKAKIVYFVHCRAKKRSFKEWLYDPSYFESDPRLTDFVAKNRDLATFGIHPSFDSFDDDQRLSDECRRFEKTFGFQPTWVRQHWLRFSWLSTWACQERNGMLKDFTLGFNDKLGFRAGAALEYRPWCFEANTCHDICTVPLVIMDSSLSAESSHGSEKQEKIIRTFVEEIHTVGGVASFLWHPHTLNSDFGWDKTLKILVEAIKR